jgi:hypothetical protein
LLVLGHPERSSSPTDTQQALKHECRSKTAVWLKECSPKVSRSISRVLVADLLRKLDAETLLNFAIHHRQNETRSRKSTSVKTMHVHSAVLHGRLMQ